MRFLKRSSTAWIAANVAALGLLVWLIFSNQSMEERLQTVLPQRSVIPEISQSAPPVVPDYSLLRNQAVFYTAREFAVPLNPSMASSPKPQYSFVAAMMLPKGNIAYLRKAQGMPSVKVRVGEVVEGWAVKTINRDQVVLELNGESFVIEAAGRAVTPGLKE